MIGRSEGHMPRPSPGGCLRRTGIDLPFIDVSGLHAEHTRMPEEQPAAVAELETFISESEQHKKDGNMHFAAADYVKAVAAYNKAIKVDPKNGVLYRYVLLTLSGGARWAQPRCAVVLQGDSDCVDQRVWWWLRWQQSSSSLHSSWKGDQGHQGCRAGDRTQARLGKGLLPERRSTSRAA